MTVTRSVVPGDWYGVLGEAVVVLLPPAAKARVSGLWERVDEGAGFDEVLDALISGGLRELPGFVLVSSEDHDVKVVIRGAGEAELTTDEGPVTVSGEAGTTWVERNVTGVTGLSVQVAEADGAPYTMETGLVRVSRVEQPARAVVETTDEPAPAAVPTEPDETGVAAAPAEPPAPPATPYVAPIPAAPVPVPPPSEAPAPAVPTGQDDTEDTQGYAPLHAAPATGDAGPPEQAQSRPVARLIFSSGEVVDVDRVIVVGRAPDARRYAGDEQARMVPVPSPNQEISSTHVEFRPGTGSDEGSAVVTDLRSTNGTVVVQPGLPAEDLQPGIGVRLVPGAIVDLGEGLTIQVTTV